MSAARETTRSTRSGRRVGRKTRAGSAWWVVGLLLLAALAWWWWLPPARTAPPLDDIDDASRARLEAVLREADRSEAAPR